MKRIGILDIGSNSLILLIADLTHPPTILWDEAVVTGLSKGLSAGSLISDENFSRSEKVFKSYRETMTKLGVTEIKAVATEALRRASNGSEIKSKIETILQAPVTLIDGDKEALLSFNSVDYEDPQEKIVFDIGGASTECCLGANNKIELKTSLKVGSVLLTEKFGLTTLKDAIPAMKYVQDLLDQSPFNNFSHAVSGIGVAGTMTSLIAMEKKLETYDRSKVHSVNISKDRVDFWRETFLSLSPTERKKIVGLEPARADVFGGGLCILSALMNYFNWSEVKCMDSGVRYGILYEKIKNMPLNT